MKNKIVVLALAFSMIMTACASAGSGDTIILAGAEKDQALKLAQQDQQLQDGRKEAQLEFQKSIDKINEGEAQLDIDMSNFVFQIKKTHSLDPKMNYKFDALNGRLTKQ